MTYLELAESFKTMNRPDRNALWWLISQKVCKIETWKFNTIFIQVFNFNEIFDSLKTMGFSATYQFR